MRGSDKVQGALFSYVNLEDRVPQDHPLRPMRNLVNQVLERLSPEFDKIYSKQGRHSIPPEQLLRALLLQVLFSIRSERQLVEQLDYNLLYRWFVGLGMDDPVWVPTVFTKNRDRLLEGDIADAFFAEVLRLAEDRKLVSREHFSVDGTLIEAWAGIKSFRRKDDDDDDSRPGVIGRNPDANFHGEKLSNETHQSTSDPESRLAKKSKGKEAKLSYAAHITTENRNGLVVAARVTQAHGRAERESALEMLEEIPRRNRITVGADKNYDYKTFTEPAREIGVTPRPPFAAERLEQGPDGRVFLRLKRQWRDGTQGVFFEPLDFLGKLAALVPPTRMHQLRFHGVYAPNARLRSLVTPDDPVEFEEDCTHETPESPGSGGSPRLSWARLMKRVFALDVLECPRCGSRMQTIAFVMAAEPIRKILNSMGYPADSPRLYPARSLEDVYELDPAA